jgi:hypothetical protein
LVQFTSAVAAYLAGQAWAQLWDLVAAGMLDLLIVRFPQLDTVSGPALLGLQILTMADAEFP